MESGVLRSPDHEPLAHVQANFGKVGHQNHHEVPAAFKPEFVPRAHQQQLLFAPPALLLGDRPAPTEPLEIARSGFAPLVGNAAAFFACRLEDAGVCELGEHEPIFPVDPQTLRNS